MSNKLVKTKSNMEKKLEYYERHCRTLEKEIGMLQAEKENLKKENVELQLKLGIDLEHIKQNKIIIKKFVSYLNLNQYKFSKKEVSDTFNISRSTLYRWLDE